MSILKASVIKNLSWTLQKKTSVNHPKTVWLWVIQSPGTIYEHKLLAKYISLYEIPCQMGLLVVNKLKVFFLEIASHARSFLRSCLDHKYKNVLRIFCEYILIKISNVLYILRIYTHKYIIYSYIVLIYFSQYIKYTKSISISQKTE